MIFRHQITSLQFYLRLDLNGTERTIGLQRVAALGTAACRRSY